MTGDQSLPNSIDLPTPVRFEAEFQRWVAIARNEAKAPQHPVDELLAEHHLIGIALDAMHAEAHRLGRRSLLRNDVWADLLDFVGNFVHLVHRRKESQCLQPRLASAGAEGARFEVVSDEHDRIGRLTLALVDGITEGDWEKVLRIAHQYVAIARPHLRGEEAGLLIVARRMCEEPALGEVQAEFARLEAFGLGERDRAYYLALVERIAHRTGLSFTA